VLERTPRHDGPLLLYATTGEARQALDLVRGRPEACFAYGFGRGDGSEGNIVFRQPSTGEFLDDLAAARAVITNGGYTLISEALYLGKPVYAIPIQNQFEQMVNGYYLERLGYGLFDLAPERRRLEMFLEGLPYFRVNIDRDRQENPERFNGNPGVFDLLASHLEGV
jgi:uncharacterized protein (TIGR00661 family)